MEEVEVIIRPNKDVRLSMSSNYHDEVFLHFTHRNGTSYVTLTKEDAKELLQGLQKIVDHVEHTV